MTFEVEQADSQTALTDLQAALRELEPSGPDGFEGLLSVIFTKIAQVDFRLAKAGLQGGKDGSTLSTGISFEAKRYDGPIPKNEVLSKLPQLISNGAPPKLWILGATVEVGTQLADTLMIASDKLGLAVLILDWAQASPLPRLAVACALAPDEVAAFLKAHLSDADLVAKATVAVARLQKVDGFAPRAATLAAQLKNPTLGIANAQQANARWLTAAFADRARARSIFGQALAPNATHAMPTQDRRELVDAVVTAMSSTGSTTLVALLGKEGHGKSWGFVQAWQAHAKPPLTVVLPAATFKSVTAYGEIGALIISKFIEQTGSDPSDAERDRWKVQVAGWGEREPETAPRFIVCVDGLNERPDVDWPRWLQGALSWIAEHGGLLVVTARSAFFNDRVRPALYSPIETISVPKWSDAELDSILNNKGVDPTKLGAEVLERLRNPRLLGIACELLDSAQVEAFSELTVDHLLFEHIRAGAKTGNTPEPVDQFVKRLADHAREIIERVKLQKIEDQLVFPQDANGGGRYELTPDLVAVTAEHFFRPLPEDPTLYELSPEGLTLALGLSLIKALQTAERSQRDIGEALDALLDPIEALDKTAEAVFSAVLVASVDQRCTTGIQRALFARVLKLQNLDQAGYAAFVAVVRNATDAAMWARYDLASTQAHIAHLDWLTAALRECRARPACWTVMSGHVRRWLRSYSDDPNLRVWNRKDRDPDEVAKEIEARAEELRVRRAELADGERALLTGMQREEFDPAPLRESALELLAGMALTSFADELVACAFSISFNSAMADQYDEYCQLIQFNRVDWAPTRTALLKAAQFMRADKASKTSRWTLVHILRATATPEDAEEAHKLAEALTADREKFPGWRLVESYCATDPCDPEASRPDNIDNTAARYADINVDELNRSRSMGEADHFFDDARPGVARFAPEQAMQPHRRLVLSLGSRDALGKWLALVEVKPHASVINAEGLALLQQFAIQHAKPYDKSKRDERDDWLISQYALLLALPHLEGDAQVKLLLSLPEHGAPLLDLQETFRASSPEAAERLLSEAVASGQTSNILMALSYYYGSRTALSDEARRTVADLAFYGKATVRGLGMAVAFSFKDEAVIRRLIADEWNANKLDPDKNFYEIWYASHLLIRGVELGLMDASHLLGRITPKVFRAAVSVLPPEALGRYLHLAINRLITNPITSRPPPVEQAVPDSADTPAYLSLVDVPDQSGGAEAFFKRLAETAEEFDARQRSGWNAFRAFETELTEDQARLAVENVGLNAVEAYVNALPDAAEGLARAIIQQPAGRLNAVVNFALMLARALSFRNPSLAVEMLRHLGKEEPFVRLVYGSAEIPLDAVSLWGSADCPEINALRYERLDSVPDDHVLAREVLAAQQEGKANILMGYVDTKLQSPIPADVARGLTVIGFMDVSAFADAALERHSNTRGMIGTAAKAARYAYERNRWSRHWFSKMATAKSPETFWPASVQFLKIVDGRVALWARSMGQEDLAQSFGPLLKSSMKRRIANWKPKREKTLLGNKTPAEIYIVSA